MELIDYASLFLTILGGAVIGRFAAVSIRATRKTILRCTLAGAAGSFLGTALAAYILTEILADSYDPGLAEYLVITVAGPALIVLLFMAWTRSQRKRDQPGATSDIVRASEAPTPVSQPLPLSIFLSYRRDDAPDAVGRIFDRLVQRFGTAHVFKDIDSIPFGVDFRQHLAAALGKCTLVLVAIGRDWNPKDPHSGVRRLDQPDDFIKMEIETALQRDIPIIPLILKGATLPTEQELPESLKGLLYRQGMFVRPDPDFHHDMDRLLEGIESRRT